MQAQLEKLNEKWQTQKLPPLKARIGIHQGKAVVGNFGPVRWQRLHMHRAVCKPGLTYRRHAHQAASLYRNRYASISQTRRAKQAN